jgi:hypothetical protein
MVTTSPENNATRRRRTVSSGRSVVVVGCSGSASCKAALAHAGRRAGANGRVLVVRALGDVAARRRDGVQLDPSRYLEETSSLVDAVRSVLPGGTRTEIRLVAASPAEALADAARHHATRELVIGASSSEDEEEQSLATALRARTALPVAVVSPGGGQSRGRARVTTE